MVYPRVNGFALAGANGLSGRLAEPYRILLILAMPGVMPASLVQAVEHEFPWIVVEQRHEIGAIAETFRHPVSLILVDGSFVEAAEAAVADIVRQHPHSIAALIENNGRGPLFSMSDVMDMRLIRGVLPMNLQLDIWLSIVRLMLCGGEYFPPHMFRLHREREANPQISERASGLQQHRGTTTNRLISALTAREVQILEMVARGLQNKTIAAKFSLSEHTVKIHLHNIIAKLGVHNRTEAAARFRDYTESGASDPLRSLPASHS